MLESLSPGALAARLAGFLALAALSAVSVAGLIQAALMLARAVQRRRAIRRWFAEQSPPTALSTSEASISDRITPGGDSDQKPRSRSY